MLELDLNTYLATVDRPEGPVVLYVENDALERAAENAIELPTSYGGKIGYALAYGLMVSFLGYLFFTF